MIKRALLVVLGFFSLCFPLTAQQTLNAGSAFALYRPEIFSTVDSSVLLQSLPVLALLNGQRLPVSSELGRMGRAPLNLFPDASLRVAEVQRINAAPIYRIVESDLFRRGSGFSLRPLERQIRWRRHADLYAG